MPKGLARSIARGSPSQAPIWRRDIRIRDALCNVAGASGIGFGSALIGALPEGNFAFLGAVAYVQFRGPTSAGLVDTWTGNYGVGTTPADDGTITGADVNIIPSTAISAATAELSPLTRGASTAYAVIDATAGLGLYLNLLVADASISADDVEITANGILHLAGIFLGDD